MINIGGNEFLEYSIPLIANNRFILVEKGNPPLVTVGIGTRKGNFEIEVLRNEPINKNPDTDVTVNASGIITISDKSSGKFLYKIRPNSNSSIVFGQLADEQEVKITDKAIYVGSNQIKNSTMKRYCVGVLVPSSGGLKIGMPLTAENFREFFD